MYEKTPGENSEGMVDSNYFIRGYAIHGYAEVPTYAASHGCLRVPIPDAPAIYAWVRTGTPVDVYNEDGGGSARVRATPDPETERLHPDAQDAREVAEAEAVDEQREQQLARRGRPIRCRAGDHAGERRGQLLEASSRHLCTVLSWAVEVPVALVPTFALPLISFGLLCFDAVFVWSTANTTNDRITIMQIANDASLSIRTIRSRHDRRPQR